SSSSARWSARSPSDRPPMARGRRPTHRGRATGGKPPPAGAAPLENHPTPAVRPAPPAAMTSSMNFFGRSPRQGAASAFPRSNGALRAAVVFGTIGCVLVAVMVQVARLQLVDVGECRRRADRQTIRSEPLPPRRGDILDRHGRLLAYDRPVLRVRAQL